MSPGFLFLAGTALLVIPLRAFGAAPVLDHLFPAAVQLGTTNVVTVIGKFDPWPPKVWTDAPGLVFKAETNSGKFTIEVGSDAPPGPHLVRVYNEQGASSPRFIIATREPQIAEVEPNDDFRKPQVLEILPASINGRLEKSGDVDSFGVRLEAGQTLVASVEAFTLASPVDAVLRILDARGVQVAFNHDGITLDPFLTWTARSAGHYVLQIFGFAYPAESDVKFTGSSKCVYRLHLSGGPYLRYTLPLGVQAGKRASLRPVSFNLKTNELLSFDGTGVPAGTEEVTLRPAGFDNALSIPVGDGPELLEQEIHGGATEDAGLEVPFAITGRIEKPGSEGRFRFKAVKEEKFLIEAQAASLGFALDAWLKVENSKGRELAKNDDSVGVDPKMERSRLRLAICCIEAGWSISIAYPFGERRHL